uniref:GP46-like surface antigen n=1 Tax=Panagrellus redivivus TaxID=6233 RepID=A0A7E4UQ04_PANRE
MASFEGITYGTCQCSNDYGAIALLVLAFFVAGILFKTCIDHLLCGLKKKTDNAARHVSNIVREELIVAFVAPDVERA